MKDSSLKIGEKYINENELEDLFNKFKIVERINKTKIRDFVTVKDLIEKRVKVKPLKKSITENKYITLKNDNLEVYENVLPFQKVIDINDYNKTKSTCMSNHNFNIVNSIASKSAKNLLLNFPGCSPVNNIKPSKKEKKNFKTINNF